MSISTIIIHQHDHLNQHEPSRQESFSSASSLSLAHWVGFFTVNHQVFGHGLSSWLGIWLNLAQLYTSVLGLPQLSFFFVIIKQTLQILYVFVNSRELKLF